MGFTFSTVMIYPSPTRGGIDDGTRDDEQGDALPEAQVDEPLSLTQWVDNHLDLIEEWFNMAAAEFYYVISLHNNSLLMFSLNLFLFN